MCSRIVRECPCRKGCPSCVGLANLRPPIHGDPDVFGSMPVPDKQATKMLLDLLGEAADQAARRAKAEASIARARD